MVEWSWVQILLLSPKLQVSHLFICKEFLDIQAPIECGFTLKRVRDMIITYSKMHRTSKFIFLFNKMHGLFNVKTS